MPAQWLLIAVHLQPEIPRNQPVLKREHGMTFSTESLAGDITRVLLDGRLDIEGAAAIDLRMNVVAGSAKFLLIDLRNVSFIGSLGLSTIVIPAQAVRRRGGKVALLDPTPMVEEVLKASKVDQVIPVFRELDAAIAALR
jgi:anti-anti-sigma factor